MIKIDDLGDADENSTPFATNSSLTILKISKLKPYPCKSLRKRYVKFLNGPTRHTQVIKIDDLGDADENPTPFDTNTSLTILKISKLKPYPCKSLTICQICKPTHETHTSDKDR